MVGYLPSIKRLDLALDLLEHLLVEDRDWQLWVAGALPWESDWVWARLLEREHYRDQFDRIRESPRLSRAVRFEGRVGNIPGWFAAVGNILSLSDLESFHLALAEGMATRAVPVIRAREGVDELFPGQPAFDDVDGMVGWLLELSADPSRRREVTEAARDLIVDRYDLAPVGEQFLDLLLEPQ
jgi:glycosyltransferase involved in cell wall biosynthesis